MLKSVSLKLVLFATVLAAVPSQACDKELQAFPRDCAIQDKFHALRAGFKRLGVDIEEIAEYRAIRFIARGDWERAKLQTKGPRWCYGPAPATFDTWDSGMRSIEGHLNPSQLDVVGIARMHASLMNANIQAQTTDHSLSAGEYRRAGGRDNGFQLINTCPAGDVKCEQVPERVWRLNNLRNLEKDNQAAQALWEAQNGEKFADVVARSGGMNPEKATTFASLQIFWGPNRVNYAPSARVAEYMSWLTIFKDYNLEKLARGESSISPIQLSADIQRWLVTIHPFADGNGRLSRAVADVILKEYDLPKAPAGDLQNDLLSLSNEYREKTYEAMDKMLDSLKECAKYHRFPMFNKNLRHKCATVKELRDDMGDQNVKCSKW